jgi:hypothetical protein
VKLILIGLQYRSSDTVAIPLPLNLNAVDVPPPLNLNTVEVPPPMNLNTEEVPPPLNLNTVEVPPPVDLKTVEVSPKSTDENQKINQQGQSTTALTPDGLPIDSSPPKAEGSPSDTTNVTSSPTAAESPTKPKKVGFFSSLFKKKNKGEKKTKK